jgi:hypothetical protein
VALACATSPAQARHVLHAFTSLYFYVTTKVYICHMVYAISYHKTYRDCIAAGQETILTSSSKTVPSIVEREREREREVPPSPAKARSYHSFIMSSMIMKKDENDDDDKTEEEMCSSNGTSSNGDASVVMLQEEEEEEMMAQKQNKE